MPVTPWKNCYSGESGRISSVHTLEIPFYSKNLRVMVHILIASVDPNIMVALEMLFLAPLKRPGIIVSGLHPCYFMILQVS